MDEIKKLSEVLKNKINKNTWKTWKFSDLVENINKKVVPKDSGLKHYIGLEHLDSGSLHIKRFGETDSLIGSKLRIYKGDLIFAKRNAYLKRVAIAEFDAVASAHSLVLRAKPKNVLPEFLPFFMLSETFWQKAIEISVGSLSPTINWKTLAKQEFLLPPIEQQGELAELFWAVDNLIEKEIRLEKKLTNTRRIEFNNIVDSSEGKYIPLSKILIPKKAKSTIPHKRTKYIGLEHIETGAFNCDNYGNSTQVKAECNIVDFGDLCYSKLRAYLDKAFISSFDAISTTELLIYDTKLVSKEYVLHYFHSRPFLHYVSSKGFGTKMPRVSHKIIGEYEVKVVKDEKKVLKKLNNFLTTEVELKSKIRSTKQLNKTILNQVF